MQNLSFPPWLKISIGCIILIFAFLIIIYAFNFRDYSLSEDPGKWGVAGDYFGGTLNPLLGIINIIFLFYLTILVSKQEDIRHINSFRYEAYNNLKKVFSDNEFNWAEISNEEGMKIKEIKSYLLDFMENDQFLFQKSEKHLSIAVLDVIENLDSLLEIHEKYKVEKDRLIREQVPTYLYPKSRFLPLLNEVFTRYSESKGSLFRLIQKSILNASK